MTNILSLSINNTDLISKSSFNYLPEQEELLNKALTSIYKNKKVQVRQLYENDYFKSNINNIYINLYENVSFDITNYTIGNTEWPAVINTRINNITTINNANNINLMPIAFYISEIWQHFMQDNLPILCFLREFLNDNPEITVLIKNPHINGIEYLLNLFNIKNKIIITEKNNFTCKKLYKIHFNPNATVYWWPPIFFNNCNNVFNIKNIIQNKLIYITRNNVKTRKITNESEVVDFLKHKALLLNLEFVYFNPEKFSMEQKHILFNEAKIVICPHGGASLHMYFCKPKTLFIEICFIKTMHAHINIALSIELNYWILPVDSDHQSISTNVDTIYIDKIFKKNDY